MALRITLAPTVDEPTTILLLLLGVGTLLQDPTYYRYCMSLATPTNKSQPIDLTSFKGRLRPSVNTHRSPPGDLSSYISGFVPFTSGHEYTIT